MSQALDKAPPPSPLPRGEGAKKHTRLSRIMDQAACCKLSKMALKVALGRIAAFILAGSGW